MQFVLQQTCEILRLGTITARFKPKGIDGGFYQRWSMWFNTIYRVEPYQFLDRRAYQSLIRFDIKITKFLFDVLLQCSGVAWLSAVRVLRRQASPS